MASKAALALPCLLALAACREDPQAALLTGHWLCTSEPADYTMSRQVSYKPDGVLSGRTEVQSTDEKTPVAMHFTFSGNWGATDGTLTEQLKTHRLMRFARESQNIPLAELPAGFITSVESSLAGASAQYEIVSVSADKLVLSYGADAVRTDCARTEAP